MKISNGRRVSIEYTMSFENDGRVEKREADDPLSFIQGEHEILEGVEEALEGLGKGDQKRVSLTPDQGYGRVDPDAIAVVEKERIPEEAWHKGAVVETQDEEGNTVAGEVTDLSKEMITVDFNHPLAGKNLQFDITVLSVTHDGKGVEKPCVEPKSGGN